MQLVEAYRTAKTVLAHRLRQVDIPSEPRFDAKGDAYFRERLEQSAHYLEYGCGSSTLLASCHVKALVSVDSEAQRIADVQRKLAAPSSYRADVKLIHINIGLTVDGGLPAFDKPTHRRMRRWIAYPSAPWRYFYSVAQEPDLILVNGGFRVACVLESLLSLPPRSRAAIFVNDYADRPYYHLLERFADVRRVGKMGVFRARPAIDRKLARRFVDIYCTDPR